MSTPTGTTFEEGLALKREGMRLLMEGDLDLAALAADEYQAWKKANAGKRSGWPGLGRAP